MRVRAHPGGADSASEHWEATLGGSHLPRLPRNVFDLPPTHPATPLTSHPLIHSSTQSSTHPSQSAVHPSIHTPSHPLIHPVSHPSTLPVIHPSILPVIHPHSQSIHPPSQSSIHPPSHPSILPVIHSSTWSSTHPSSQSCTFPSFHSFIHFHIHLPTHPSTPPFFIIHPSFCLVQSLSHIQLFATPWTAAHQASLSITNSQSSLKLMSIESVMPSNHLILCRPLLLLPSVFPSIRVFSNESALHIRWPKYWSFSFSISPSNEHPGLISFKMD